MKTTWQHKTKEQALVEAQTSGLPGWNIRCNCCGSYGASWLHGMRHDRGPLALCEFHRDLLLKEMQRHQGELHRLTEVFFEQDK